MSGLALLSWATWAVITFEIGTRLMPESKTRADVGQLLRTIGFSAAPGMLRIFGIVPGATLPAFVITAIWMLVAMVVAVRQALDYQSTARAVAVCGLGWALSIGIAVVLQLVLRPDGRVLNTARNCRSLPRTCPLKGLRQVSLEQ